MAWIRTTKFSIDKLLNRLSFDRFGLETIWPIIDWNLWVCYLIPWLWLWVSLTPGVPNLWYAYHWWYAERSQVVRKEAELFFVWKQNWHFLLIRLILNKNCSLHHNVGRVLIISWKLRDDWGILSVQPLLKTLSVLSMVVRKILVCSFGGTRLKKGWEPLSYSISLRVHLSK